MQGVRGLFAQTGREVVTQAEEWSTWLERSFGGEKLEKNRDLWCLKREEKKDTSTG